MFLSSHLQKSRVKQDPSLLDGAQVNRGDKFLCQSSGPMTDAVAPEWTESGTCFFGTILSHSARGSRHIQGSVFIIYCIYIYIYVCIYPRTPRFTDGQLGWVGGVGCGGDNVSLTPSFDRLLHLMLSYLICSCIWCYVTWSSLALHATSLDLSCTWCYVTWSSLALDAPLLDLLWRLMLRCLTQVGIGLEWGGDNTKRVSLHHLIFSCTWCYLTWSSLPFDAASLDLLLRLMLRRLNFSCTDALVLDLLLRLMLRCLIFFCAWCFAAGRSFALDARCMTRGLPLEEVGTALDKRRK